MRYLALWLLIPVALILAGIYWVFPLGRRPGWPRRLFDLAVLLVAAWLGARLAIAGFDAVPEQMAGSFGRASGGVWKQVLPALYGYGAFTLVLTVGLFCRFLLFRRPRG